MRTRRANEASPESPVSHRGLEFPCTRKHRPSRRHEALACLQGTHRRAKSEGEEVAPKAPVSLPTPSGCTRRRCPSRRHHYGCPTGNAKGLAQAETRARSRVLFGIACRSACLQVLACAQAATVASSVKGNAKACEQGERTRPRPSPRFPTEA